MTTIDFLICSKDNADELKRVTEELDKNLNPAFESFLYVIPKDGYLKGSQFFNASRKSYVQEPKGSTIALHYGFQNSSAKWVCWLNDDIGFKDSKVFIESLRREIDENKDTKLFGFVENRNKQKAVNIGRHCSFGCVRKDFYFEHYENGNPYIKYFWDNEIMDFAIEAGCWKQTNIEIEHYWNHKGLDKNQYKSDEDNYNERRIKRVFPRTVAGYFKNKIDTEFLIENIRFANKGKSFEMIEDNDKFLISEV